MKPTIHKRKNARGRITGYAATLGPIEASGATAAEAAERAEKEAGRALERLSRGAKIGHWRGQTYVITPDIGGWAYWLETFNARYFVGRRGSLETTELDAIHHLAQNLWTHDTDDRTFLAGVPDVLREGLAYWMTWQRQYKAARDAGHSDETARELAGNLRPVAELLSPAVRELLTCPSCGSTAGPVVPAGSADAQCAGCLADWRPCGPTDDRPCGDCGAVGDDEAHAADCLNSPDQ